MSDTYPRAAAPREATWNREAVFASWDDYAAELDSLQEELPALASYAGKLGQPSQLLAWLHAADDLINRLGRLSTYAALATAVDTADTRAKAHFGQMRGLGASASASMAFAAPEITAHISADPGAIDRWVAAEPGLSEYRRYFRALEHKARFRLSAEVETVLGGLGKALGAGSQTLSELSGSDMRFPDAADSQGKAHPVRQGTFMAHYTAADRALRKSAWESYNDGYRQYANTFAAAYLGLIEQSRFETQTRGFDSILHARLEPSGLPVSVFHNLINTFVENLPVWHRYWAVKQRILGLDSMRPWDRWAPLSGDGPDVPYSTATAWLLQALGPMGDEYLDVLRKGSGPERWVDWAPNTGKRQGAFSVPAYPGSFPFIMMTYNNSVFSMSTLAHELGHSMHHHLAHTSQRPLYHGTGAVWRSSAIAETASNFHQAMLRTWLRSEHGDDEALMLAIIDEAMMNYHRYCFLMPTLARFELEVSRRAESGEPLNAPILGEIMLGYFAEGYGDVLEDDPQRTAITWAQFQHLYTPFYTFQYAVGISAASILADRIQSGEPGSVDSYLSMLRSGYSLPAIDTFAIAGIDMTGTAPMTAMFSRLDALVSLLEERAG